MFLKQNRQPPPLNLTDGHLHIYYNLSCVFLVPTYIIYIYTYVLPFVMLYLNFNLPYKGSQNWPDISIKNC